MEKDNFLKPNEEPKTLGKRQLDQEEISKVSKKGRLQQEEESSLRIMQEPNTSRNRVYNNNNNNNNNNNKIIHSQGKDEFFMEQRLQSISGPTLELESRDLEEYPFSNRNRLYVGNMTNDMEKEKLEAMFKQYGGINDIFLNVEKNFAFVKVDFHENAVKAKRALDGSLHNGRTLRVRFAPSQSIVRVRNLSRFVSNELLYKSFEIFGTIERAVVMVTDRGNHMGEGIVEFAMRSSALACLRSCQEHCYYLTAEVRPCIVEPMEINDDHDGLPEKLIVKTQPGFIKDRSVGPRFADPDSFEHEYGSKFKRLLANYNNKKVALEREYKLEEMKLEAELEHARNERETEILRKELKQREADRERLKLELQMRQNQSQQLILPIRHKSYLHAPIRRFGRKRATGFERMRNYAHDARNNMFNNLIINSFNNFKNSIIQIRQYQD